MTNRFRGFTDRLNENARQRQNWLRGGSSSEELRLQERLLESVWTPDMDVLARGEDLVLLIDLPGVRLEEVELALSDGLLTISGESSDRHSQETVSEEYYTRERGSGTFYRSMSLPIEVREDRIEANLEAGVLEITIEGYARLSEPRRIEIKGSQERLDI